MDDKFVVHPVLSSVDSECTERTLIVARNSEMCIFRNYTTGLSRIRIPRYHNYTFYNYVSLRTSHSSISYISQNCTLTLITIVNDLGPYIPRS